jgi:hypothetical protein
MQGNAELPPPAITESPLLAVPTTSNTNDEYSSSADSFVLYSHGHMEQLASQFEWYYWDNSDLDETTEWTHHDHKQPDSDDDEPCITNELLQFLLDQELPANHCTQVEKLHPVEDDLMILMKKNHLPIHLYQDFLSWGARASLSEYDFKASSIYKTTLDYMKKKYSLEAGLPPVQGTVNVEGPFPPMHVYHFSLLHEVKRLLQDPDNLKGAMWKYQETRDATTGEHVYGKLNSGDWWKNAQASLDKDLHSTFRIKNIVN